MGVEIQESPVSPEEFAAMEEFVHDYLAASVENDDEGGRMRWYPWHSAAYRFNHIRNVVDLAGEIARAEGANVDVTRVAALFHDIAKLEVDQDVHAEEGARIAREYLYEARTHMDAAEMVGRVVERGQDARDRVESRAALDIAHRRIKRVRWLQEWLEEEVAGIDLE
ncbi:phosphohydrolase [Halobacteriales archaeon SW_10_68_16]|nr:MAG: phosphohydrolase [Halobacteriales archaeon SW_10_68_16]